MLLIAALLIALAIIYFHQIAHGYNTVDRPAQHALKVQTTAPHQGIRNPPSVTPASDVEALSAEHDSAATAETAKEQILQYVMNSDRARMKVIGSFETEDSSALAIMLERPTLKMKAEYIALAEQYKEKLIPAERDTFEKEANRILDEYFSFRSDYKIITLLAEQKSGTNNLRVVDTNSSNAVEYSPDGSEKVLDGAAIQGVGTGTWEHKAFKRYHHLFRVEGE